MNSSPLTKETTLLTRVVGRTRGLKLLSDFITLSGGEAFSKIVGFIAFAHLARTLETELYGTVEFAVALSMFFATIVDCGLGPIGVRRLTRGEDDTASLAAQIPTTRLFLAPIALCLMVLIPPAFGFSVEIKRLVFLFALGLLAMPWQQNWLFQGVERMGVIAGGQLIRTLIFAVGVFVFVRQPMDVFEVGYVEIASMTAMAVYYLVVQQLTLTPVRLSIQFRQIAQLAREGSSIGLAHIVWAFHQYVPVVLVTYYVGGKETAWFGSAHRVVASLLAFGYLYHFNLYPAIARRMNEPDQSYADLIRVSYRIVAWVGIFLSVVLTVFAEPIVVLLFGPDFAQASLPFAVLVWFLPITAIAGHARWSLLAAGKQKFVLLAQSAGAVCMVAFGLLLIPQYRAFGAAIATLCACTVVWLVAQISARRQIAGFPLPFAAVRPALLAFLSLAIALTVDGADWIVASISIGLFAILAPVIDRNIVPDFRRLAKAKSDANEETQAHGDEA